MLDILILLCAFSVITAIYRIFAQQKCPSESTLRRFMGQSLRAREKDQVISHLGVCEKCQKKLEEITFGKKNIERP